MFRNYSFFSFKVVLDSQNRLDDWSKVLKKTVVLSLFSATSTLQNERALRAHNLKV